MRDLSDEVLMAYADGELDGATRASVEAALVNSSDAQARLNVFRTTSTNLRDLYEAAYTEPVPQHLIDAVRNSALVGDAENVVPFSSRQRVLKPVSTVPAQLMAASIAVAALAAGVYLATRNGPHDPTGFSALMASSGGQVLAGAALADALSTVPTKSVKSILSGETKTAFTAVFTFKTADGQYCRQYELENQAANAARAGVVCRGTDGAWVVKGDVPVEPRKSDNGAIVPAAKESSAAVDAIVDGLIEGDVLSAADEAAVIKNGWRGEN